LDSIPPFPGFAANLLSFPAMPAYRWPWIALTFAYCAYIFYLSSQPDLGFERPEWMDWPHSDKLAHFGMYGGLGGLVALGLWRSNPVGLPPRQLFLGPVLFAALYGLSDEIHQIFVPERTFDLLDLLADAAGATMIAGVFTHWTVRRRARA
jgi:VanZ family protein